MTLKKILNLQPHELRTLYHNKAELSKAVSTMRKEVKRRSSEIEKSGLDSYAVTQIERRGGIPKTIRGMNEEELRGYFKRFKVFLTDPTSTVNGIHLQLEKIVKDLGLDISFKDKNKRKKSEEEKKELKEKYKKVQTILEVWTMLREASTTIKPKTEIYYNVLEVIQTSVNNGKPIHEILSDIKADLDAEYLARELEYEQRRSTASYFSTASDFTPFG